MRIPFILDTDIGTNPDDFFALLILLNHPAADVKLVLTGNGYPAERARFAKKIIENAGRDIPVYSGEPTGHIGFFGQEYVADYFPAIPGDYRNAAKAVLESSERITYLAIQGCSNLANILRSFPEYRNKTEIVHMGMTSKDAREGYVSGGTNMEADPLAAKFVYELGINMKVVGSHTTINDALRVRPETKLYKKIEASRSPNHQILLRHLHDYRARRNIWPALHDPLAASVALGESFVSFEEVATNFNAAGQYSLGTGSTRVSLSTRDCNAQGFMEFCEEFA